MAAAISFILPAWKARFLREAIGSIVVDIFFGVEISL